MPRYYFVIERDQVAADPGAGIEFPDMDAAWEEATKATGEIIREIDGSLEVGSEWSVQIQDERRKPLRTIRVRSESHE